MSPGYIYLGCNAWYHGIMVPVDIDIHNFCHNLTELCSTWINIATTTNYSNKFSAVNG